MSEMASDLENVILAGHNTVTIHWGGEDERTKVKTSNPKHLN